MEPPKNFEFEIVRDQFLSVDRLDLIQSMMQEFGIKLTSDDIKIVKDGTELVIQLGTQNPSISTLTLKKIADFMTSSVIDQVSYDEQIFKLWINPSPEYIFVDSGDENLQVVKGGINAPAGTVQVSIGNHLYTLLYPRPDALFVAVRESLTFLGKPISTKPMTNDQQVDDHRISIIRKKFGQSVKMYNDRIHSDKPIVDKVIFHI